MRRPIVYAAFLAAVLAGLLHAQGDGKQKEDPKIPADGEKTITTKSGLQYSVLTKGKGTEKPRMGDKVKVHYSGWLTDGKLFDSSVKRGAPMEFVLGAVIEGWNEGLQLMVPGDRFKFTIPSKLGYGEMGSPGSIPPNATLIFEVELISFLAMPRFQALDAKKAKTTKSGLRYQILKEGAGDVCKDSEAFELKFAFWNKDKQLVQCTEQVGGTIKGKSENMRLAFLKEAPQLMKAGAVVLFEVPSKLAWGAQRAGPLVPANSTTFWKLELVRIMRPLPLPKFSLPKDDELKKTPTGLKYQVIKEGKGPKPKAFDTVTCHYAGWLTDGTLFDSSYGRGDTSSFPLSGVIKGWTEGLQLMNVGSTYKFVIPGDLAYGPQGSPPKIGPDATLVFIIELVKIGK